MTAHNLLRRIVFLGAPGVGKGTYASRLAERLHLRHVNFGDRLRAEADSPASELGPQLREYMRRGALVPDDVMAQVLRKALDGSADNSRGFILDGFPRTLRQAELLDSLVPIDFALLLTLPRELLSDKLAARRVCRACGRTFNFASLQRNGYNMPPLLPDGCRFLRGCECERDGAGGVARCVELAQRCTQRVNCDGALCTREDDRTEVVRDRLAVYDRESGPVEAHYERQGKLRRFALTGTVGPMLPRLERMIMHA